MKGKGKGKGKDDDWQMKQAHFCTYCRVFREKDTALIQLMKRKGGKNNHVSAYQCNDCGSRYLMEE